jgi:O-antigen/teichoic acid export membrane protein
VVLFYTAFVFLNILYTYGTESAYLKFAADSESPNDRSSVFSVAVCSLGVSSIFLSVVLVLLAREAAALIGAEPEWQHLVYYAAGILTLDTLAVVPFAELRLRNAAVRFAVLKTISIVTNVGLNIWLIVGLRSDIDAIFQANLAASAVTLILLAPVFRTGLRWSVRKDLWVGLMRFGLPFLPGGLGYAVTDRVNLFFLGRMERADVLRLYGDDAGVARLVESSAALANSSVPVGDAVFGQYVAGVFGTVWKLGILMMLFAQMFRFAWQPFFLQRQKDPDAHELFGRVFTVFTALAGAIFLGVSFFAQELVSVPLPGGRTLIERSYWLGLYLVPIALLAYVFQGWYYNFSAGVYITGRTRYFVHCSVAGALTAIVVNAWFVPSFGMTAAAWATAGAYGVMTLVLFALIRPHYAIRYETLRVIALLGTAATAFALWWKLPQLQAWPYEMGMIIVYGAIAAGALYWPATLGGPSQADSTRPS